MKKSIKERILPYVFVGGMLFYGGSVALGAYLHYLEPKAPLIYNKYISLNEELDWLNVHTFTLEEATNEKIITTYKNKKDSLVSKIEEIRKSENYSKIKLYESAKKKSYFYGVTPIISAMVGISFMFYTIKLESEIEIDKKSDPPKSKNSSK